MPIIVLTGVECAGKSTIGQLLSLRMNWPLIPEAARTDAAVLAGKTSHQDLQRLQDQFIEQVQSQLGKAASEVILCDTGGLVLDIWAQEVFGQGLARTKEAMALIDLHLLFHTLAEWHTDPLRTLPNLKDRLALQDRYRERLIESKCTFEEVYMASEVERFEQARELILRHGNA